MGHQRSIRSGRIERCDVCRLAVGLCLCGQWPTVASRPRILVIRHSMERKRPSNTGRVLCHMMPDARLLDFGAPEERLTEDAVRAAIGADRPVVLYPQDDASVLAPEMLEGNERLCLIALDGTWGQASSMNRRVPGLAGIPRVRLPDGTLPVDYLRKNHMENRCSTAEAVIHACSALGDVDAAAQLRMGLNAWVTRARSLRHGGRGG